MVLAEITHGSTGRAIGTFGARACTTEFTACRSWRDLFSFGWPASHVFLFRNTGVPNGEVSQGITILVYNNASDTGVIHCTASGYNGYCSLQGWKEDFGITCATPFISPTSYSLCAHNLCVLMNLESDMYAQRDVCVPLAIIVYFSAN